MGRGAILEVDIWDRTTNTTRIVVRRKGEFGNDARALGDA